MSSFYTKGRGRKTSLEKSQIHTIEQLIEQHNIDISKYNVATTPAELGELKEKLVSEFGTPEIKKDEFPKTEGDLKVSQEPSPEPEPKQSPEPSPEPTPIKDNFSLSQFVEDRSAHPFAEEFKKEDLFKAGEFMEDDSAPTPSQSRRTENLERLERLDQEEPTQVSDSTRNPLDDIASSKNDKLSALDRLDQEESSEESPADQEKTKLAKTTSKKATKSLARQTTKIFTFLSEWGVKKFSKISEKTLDKLESEGKLDRDFIFDETGKSVAELVEEHNDFIEEFIAVDEDSKEDLEEAIMLVAEKHQIEVSPEANLGIVLVSILIGLGKAGYDQKQSMNKTLKRIGDTYRMQTQKLAQKDAEIERLQNQLTQQQPRQVSFTPEPSPEPATDGIKTLSFDLPRNEKFDFSESENRERNFEEAGNMIETITSDVSGDTKPAKKTARKPAKKTTRKPAKAPAKPKK